MTTSCIACNARLDEELYAGELCAACLKAKSEAIEAYNSVAQTYADRYCDEILLKPKVQTFLQDFVKPIDNQEVICDLGCGPAQVARYLHRNLGRKAVGMDISPGMIANAQKLNPEIDFRCQDVLEDSDADLYGGIIGLYFIVNFTVPQLPQVFNQVNRLLKANGKLLISFHIGNNEQKRIDDFWESGKPLSFYFFKTETVSQAMQQAGFKVEDIKIREPDTTIEYNSQRAYIFAGKH